MLDRIKLQICIKNNPNKQEIHENFIRNGRKMCCHNTHNTHIDGYKIKSYSYSVIFYPITEIVILDFNVARFYYGINVGTINNNDFYNFIFFIDTQLQVKLNLTTSILDWNINSVEIKKDIKVKNKVHAQAIIDTLRKCSKGSLKARYYNTSYYRYSKNKKICVYLKADELKAHNKWDSLSEFEKNNIKNTIRWETTLTQKKLISIIKKMGNKSINKVLLKDVMKIELQKALLKNSFEDLGLTGKLLSKTALLQFINNLSYSTKKKNNLVKFVLALNSKIFKKVKSLFASTYKYLKIFKEHDVCPYYIDTCRIMLKQKYNYIFLKDSPRNKGVPYVINQYVKNNLTFYNIYTIFDISTCLIKT